MIIGAAALGTGVGDGQAVGLGALQQAGADAGGIGSRAPGVVAAATGGEGYAAVVAGGVGAADLGCWGRTHRHGVRAYCTTTS